MQKKLSLALSFVLLTGLTNFINANLSDIQKIICGVSVVAIGSGGVYAQRMNNEYSKSNRNPDLNMRLTKGMLLGTTIIGIDFLLGDLHNTPNSLARVGALLLAMTATTETVADAIRQIPLLDGFLTDPVDEHGHEKKDFGAIARFALVFVPLRSLAVYCFPPTIN